MKRFHSFRLDPLNQCIWRGKQRVPITPKAFDVLRYLVEHPGRLVTQEEILEALWPETYVNQEVVKKYILEIRKVLGDRHDQPIFIETFPRRGYQFVAQVIEEGTAAPSDLSLDAKSKMVGRGAALAGLERALDQALRGERQMVFVTGEAGIGKTMLVDVFHQRAARHPNMRIARGQCVEGFGGKEAYYPMLEALGQLTRDADGSSIVQTLATRAPTWLIQFPSLVKAEQREALQREILGATRERMVREICAALEVLTAEHPLVLVLEDLHWVDPSTLDAISALARRREAAKLLLLCTYRPVDVALSQSPLKGLKQDLQVHHLCEEIALERLEESEIAQYLAIEFASGSLPSDLANLIYRHSGGNALFMVAIVQDMVKKGLIVQDKGGWRLTTPLEKIDPDVPETLQLMLEVQLDQLSVPEQRILKSASVAGERFSVWAITTTLDIAPHQIEDLCEGLAERQQFIKSTGIEELSNGSVSARYEFRHSLYRQVIYRRLSDVTRSKLHRGLGARLKSLCTLGKREQEMASELALHFERGREYEQAIRYLMLTAENAAGRFAYRDVIQVLQQALKLLPKVTSPVGAELEIQILEFIGDAHYALGAMADSAKAYEAGAARAAQVGLRAAQVNALTCLMRPFGLIDPDQGIAAIDQAEQVSRSLDDPLLLARTQMLAAAVRLLYDTWRKEDAELCASAHQMMRHLGDSSTPPYHQMIYGYIQALQGNYREAFEIFEAFIPKMDETTSLMAYHWALGGKTFVLLYLGEFGEVLRLVRAEKEMAKKNANDPWLFNFREAWLHTLALDFAGARRVCESIASANAECPTGQPETIARIAGGYAELERGNFDQASEYFRQVGDPQITPKFFQHWFWRLTAQLGLSHVWLESGDLSKARSEAGVFLQSALSTANPYLQALAWEMKSRIAIAEQDWNGAREYVDQALAVLEEFEVPVAAWRVHATAWDLYLHAKDDKEAETHRACAEAHILTIANSFATDEPLRQSFLAAAPVRRILSNRKTRNTSLALGLR
jgi:DNA-binding winged helix-turn-helix (wHTH) protein/tetratricopeptide (TPR) repeat protein